MALSALQSASSRRLAAFLSGIGLVALVLLGGCAATRATATATARPLPTASTAPAPTRAAASSPTPTLNAFTATPISAGCTEKQGRVERRQLDSPHLPRPLQVRVYLPPCYTDAGEAYPLLLMLHGQAADAGQWITLGLFEAADRLIAQNRIPAMLIALPQEDDTLANPFESGFDRALVEDLLPWLRQEYAACTRRDCTTVGGLSRGAAWAMYIGLSHPNHFGAIGAHSFPSFYGDENRLPLLLREIPTGQLPRIWMDSGERDRYITQAHRYHDLLEQYAVPHAWRIFPGEHDAAYWAAHVEDYLLWYAQPGNS